MPAAPWYFGTLGRSCVLFFPSKELINSLLAGQCVPVFGCMAFGNHVCPLSLYICSENLQIVVYSVPWQGCSVGWDCTWLICLWEGFSFLGKGWVKLVDRRMSFEAWFPLNYSVTWIIIPMSILECLQRSFALHTTLCMLGLCCMGMFIVAISSWARVSVCGYVLRTNGVSCGISWRGAIQKQRVRSTGILFLDYFSL